MTLNPVFKPIIAGLNLAGILPFKKISRFFIAKGMQKIRKYHGPPPSLDRIVDIKVPVRWGSLEGRIYEARQTGEIKPIIFFVHGGGWRGGSVEALDIPCRTLAVYTEAIVVSVNYRLAPKYKYPCALEDVYDIFKWIQTNASELGGDPEQIWASGESAGGNLIAGMALRIAKEGGKQAFGHILIYPALDYAKNFDTDSYRELGSGYGLSLEKIRGLWDGYLTNPETEADNPEVSPLQASLQDLEIMPKTIILTAEYDPSRDDAENYGKKLESAKVPVIIKRWLGVPHAFIHFIELDPGVLDAYRFIDKCIRDWFKNS